MKQYNGTGTREMADDSVSLFKGCEGGCLACWNTASEIKRGHLLQNCRTISVPKETFKTPEQMKGKRIFCFYGHNISMSNIQIIIEYLLTLLQSGKEVLIVSKPWLECIKLLVDALSNFKDNIIFCHTITSIDDRKLMFMEPGTSLFKERIDSLDFTLETGYVTDVIIEPFWDEDPSELISIISAKANQIWFGKANHLEYRCKMNGVWDQPHVPAIVQKILHWQRPERLQEIYDTHKDNSKIIWKKEFLEAINIK